MPRTGLRSVRLAISSIALSLVLSQAGSTPPAALAFQDTCPVVSLDVMNAVFGQALTIDPNFISSYGSRDECIFENEVGIVLVGREKGFFSASGPGLSNDDLAGLSRMREDVIYTTESGIGDAASWVEHADPAERAERLSVLVVRRGADAFFFGVDQSAFSDVQTLTKALAQAVLLASP